MRITATDHLFKSVASTIQGTWHNFNSDEILIFSQANTPLDVCDMVIIRQDRMHSDYYLLGLQPNHEVYILMGDQSGIANATIKVITNDTLILQKPDKDMVVYKRRQDHAFADAVIAGL